MGASHDGRNPSMIRKMIRRLAGRNGPPPAPRRPPTTPEVQVHKTQTASRAAREARQAVDSFTASVERAMRGQA